MTPTRRSLPATMTPEAFVAEVAGAMTEAVLQTRVEQHARGLGWRHYHAPDNRPGGRRGRVQRVTPGFPDLVLVHPAQRRILYAELKRQRGRQTPEQREWADLLSAAGAEVYLWRPADLLDGTIDRILTGRPAA